MSCEDEEALAAQFEASCKISEPPSPPQLFIDNFARNTLLAFLTVPPEGLAVRRILYLLNNPNQPAPSYISAIRNGNLFMGWHARTSYCLLGNFSNLVGLKIWEDDSRPVALLKTTALKNLILPFSLWSNEVQDGKTTKESWRRICTESFVIKKHAWFFSRNFLSNFGLWPGLEARDYVYQKSDNVNLAQIIGFTTSCIFSGILNSFVKPGMTKGDYPPAVVLKTACRLPALTMIIIRESVSVGFQFFHTSPKNRD